MNRRVGLGGAVAGMQRVNCTWNACGEGDRERRTEGEGRGAGLERESRRGKGSMCRSESFEGSPDLETPAVLR